MTGWLIPQNFPQAIAEAVLEMVRHREAALAMAEQGRGRVLQQVNPEYNYRRVLEIFQEADQDRQACN